MATKTTYKTLVIPEGQHASLEIPDKNLAEINGNKRAPLKVSVNGHTYQSTATGVSGQCRVVFPTKDREAAGVSGGDIVTVTLELDSGYREVDMSDHLKKALETHHLSKTFHDLNYSTRKEYARLVNDAKTDETRDRRITKILEQLK